MNNLHAMSRKRSRRRLSSPTVKAFAGREQIRYARAVDGSDEQLMLDYAAGNMRSFEMLYGRHKGGLYRYFRRQVSDEMTANDLYQGVWERVIQARERYQPTAKFSTWLYRIAHNLLVDHYRRVKPGAKLDPERLLNQDQEIDEQLVVEEQSAELRTAIETLPAEQRAALLLKLDQDMSLEAIAEVMDCGRETVKSRLRYATKKLKHLMRP